MGKLLCFCLLILTDYTTLSQTWPMEQRNRKKQISLCERKKFIEMWREGKSCNAIAKERGTTPATVCRWINRWKQEGNISTKHRTKRLLWNLQNSDVRKYYNNVSFHDINPSARGRKPTDILLPDCKYFLYSNNLLYYSMLLRLLSIKYLQWIIIILHLELHITLDRFCKEMETWLSYLEYYAFWLTLCAFLYTDRQCSQISMLDA